MLLEVEELETNLQEEQVEVVVWEDLVEVGILDLMHLDLILQAVAVEDGIILIQAVQEMVE